MLIFWEVLACGDGQLRWAGRCVSTDNAVFYPYFPCPTPQHLRVQQKGIAGRLPYGAYLQEELIVYRSTPDTDADTLPFNNELGIGTIPGMRPGNDPFFCTVITPADQGFFQRIPRLMADQLEVARKTLGQ